MARTEDTTTDAALVAAVLAGDPDAATRLVRRFERPVIGVIVRLVKDRELARDLAQETFVKAFRHLGSFDPSRRFSSWLFKIAHNTTLDWLRKGKLDTESLVPEDDDRPERQVAAPEERSPFQMAARSELARGLEQALGSCRPAHREILLLRFVEHLQYQEIADVLGVKMNVVKVRLHRARKELAENLAAAGFSAPERFSDSGKGTS